MTTEMFMGEESNLAQKSEPQKLDEFEHVIPPLLTATIAILVGFVGTITLTWLLGDPFAPVMDELQNTKLYHLIPFLFSITFFGILVYKAYIKNIRGLNFLAGAVLLHGLGEFMNVFSNSNGTFFDRGDLISSIADLFFPIAVILLYLHIELTEKTRPNLIHAIGIIGTAAPIIVGGSVLIIAKQLEIKLHILDELRNIVLVYLGVFALIILWVSFFAIRVMYSTLKLADTSSVSNGSMMVLVGFSALITDFLVFGVSYSTGLRNNDQPLIFHGNEFKFHNSYLITFALICMMLPYILYPGFAYAPPFDVYQILVINSEYGVTLFSFVNEVRSEGSLTHAALNSAAIVAIQNLVQEISQTEGHIRLIGMSDRILIMKSHESVVSVLISQKNSYFINNGLRDFNREFYNKFQHEIENFTGNVEVFKGANQLIRKYLPFMRKESLVVD